MPLSISEMIAEVTRLRNRIETSIVEDQVSKPLMDAFAAAESGMVQQRELFRTLKTDNSGRIVRSIGNITAANKIADDMRVQVDKWIVGPGRKWADRVTPILQNSARDLARVNFDVGYLSQDLLDEVFSHVPAAERAVLKVGKQRMYTITGTVGDDVQTWFRNEMLDAITNGLPVQGSGSLAQRLFESGRLKPIVVRTEKGRLIRRSLQARANAIARVESAKLINEVHDTLGDRALGAERVALNSNPTDSRTTNICSAASRQPPMTKDEWIASRFGLPPRLTGPFHWCRSTMIWGMPDWFDDDEVPKRETPPPPPPPPKAKPKRAPRKAKPKTPAAAEVVSSAAEKARLADMLLAKNTAAPVQDRIAAYGRVTGNAKIDQIKALQKHQPAQGARDLVAEQAMIDKRISALHDELDRLSAEEAGITSTGAGTRFAGQDLRKVYPSIGNRRQAVPRLQEIADQMDDVAGELDTLGERKFTLGRAEYAAGLESGGLGAVGTPELRAQVMKIMRTEGDGIGTSHVARPRNAKVKDTAFDRRTAAADAAEEGRDWVSGLLDPKATSTGVAHNVDVKWLGGDRAFARQSRGTVKNRPRPRPGDHDGDMVKWREDYEAWQLEGEPLPHSVHLPRDRQGSDGIKGRSTTVHEYGHTVEYATKADGMSREFYLHRIGPGAEQKTMKRWGFDWYKDQQRTNPDKFQDVMDSWAGDRASEFAHYTGKQYDHGSTEIMSMGMEAFYRDPIGFVTKDPEWANYIFGVLDGGFKP